MTDQTEPKNPGKADEQQESADELRAEIADTRARLGDTVEALTQKLDVKERGKAKAEELRATAMDRAETAVAALPEPMVAPARRGIGAVLAHPVVTVAVAIGVVLVVRGVAKRRNQ